MNILAIDIGGTSVKYGLADLAGNITDFKEFASESSQGGQHVINTIIQTIHEEFSRFNAIGISTAGQVDSAAGTIIYANENIPGYTGMNLKGIFEAEFQVPVSVENDVNAAALGELHFGNGQNHQDFLCLTYGTGIGGAIVLDADVYKGYTGSSAEFGHMITHPEGLACNCGGRGCYEVYASTTALVSAAKQYNMKYTNGRKIFQGIEKGDLELANILEAWVSEIAYGLTSLIHIFNPPAIIIGGGIMEQSTVVSLIKQRVETMMMDSFANVKILPARLGNQAGLLGAVSLHLPIKQ